MGSKIKTGGPAWRARHAARSPWPAPRGHERTDELLAQIAANAQRMRLMAARLPACVIPAGQCPIHKHEAPPPGRDEASTTMTTTADGARGCGLDGTT